MYIVVHLFMQDTPTGGYENIIQVCKPYLNILVTMHILHEHLVRSKSDMLYNFVNSYI